MSNGYIVALKQDDSNFLGQISSEHEVSIEV